MENQISGAADQAQQRGAVMAFILDQKIFGGAGIKSHQQLWRKNGFAIFREQLYRVKKSSFFSVHISRSIDLFMTKCRSGTFSFSSTVVHLVINRPIDLLKCTKKKLFVLSIRSRNNAKSFSCHIVRFVEAILFW